MIKTLREVFVHVNVSRGPQFCDFSKNHENLHFFIGSPIILSSPSQSFPIFGSTFLSLFELFSWTKWSDLRNVLFSKLPIHSNQRKNPFGAGYGRSSGCKTL